MTLYEFFVSSLLHTQISKNNVDSNSIENKINKIT